MDDGEGFGLKFWASMIGIILAISVGGLIVFLIFTRAVLAWGFFGAFLALGALIVLGTWLYDRRSHRGFMS
jgi:hypothetical protein